MSDIPLPADLWEGRRQPLLGTAPVVEELASEQGLQVKLAQLVWEANSHAGRLARTSIRPLRLTTGAMWSSRRWGSSPSPR